MPTITLTLDTAKAVTGQALSFYDGENFKLQIARNGVTGMLVLAIASRSAGETPGAEPLGEFEVPEGGADLIDAAPAQTAFMTEGRTYYWSMFAFDGGSGERTLVADGTVTRRAAVVPIYAVTAAIMLFGADTMLFGADTMVFS